MKKVITIIVIAFAVLCIGAYAESIDISGLSFQELADLRDRVQLEMFSRDEWQEVTVPQGVWFVGRDIPAGTWTVKCKDGDMAGIGWGDVLAANGQEIDRRKSNRSDGVLVCNPRSEYTHSGDRLEYTFTVSAGDYIVISHSSACFSPYVGNPDLGFK